MLLFQVNKGVLIKKIKYQYFFLFGRPIGKTWFRKSVKESDVAQLDLNVFRLYRAGVCISTLVSLL